MIVAAHQPCYLPWLGYFDKIARCDLFVLLDDVQYEHQNFQNRNRLKVNNGVVWVTVPLHHASRDERVCDKRITVERPSRNHWQRRTWGTLLCHYGATRHFARYAAELEDVYRRPWERLIDLDRHLLELCLRWLEIDTPIRLASEIGVLGQKTDLIRSLCQRTGATRYLSGCGGSRSYLDVARLADDGVEVEWQEFRHPSYPQRYPVLGFVPRLSVLDLILNCGPSSASVLRSDGTARRFEIRSAMERPETALVATMGGEG